MKAYQLKISALVEGYKKAFQEDYVLMCRVVQGLRGKQKTKFAEMPQTGYNERLLGEYPETLDAIFNLRLTQEEKDYFNSKKGARWFFKKYKEFSMTDDLRRGLIPINAKG